MRALLFVSLLASQIVWARPYEPSILRRTLERVRREVSVGHHPIVVFDLDDTLLDTRDRSVRIFHDLARTPNFRTRFPYEAGRIASLRASDIGYSSEAALKRVGVQNAAALKEAKAFWAARFFTSRYVAEDVPLPGAPQYVRSLWDAGADVLYLTGRTEKTMGEGTRSNLALRGFPFGGDRARLIAQRGERVADFDFKREALGQIGRSGTVVALFENEGRNLNLMHALFPKALSIFVDTLHSDESEDPDPACYWVRDYTGR